MGGKLAIILEHLVPRLGRNTHKVKLVFEKSVSAGAVRPRIKDNAPVHTSLIDFLRKRRLAYTENERS